MEIQKITAPLQTDTLCEFLDLIEQIFGKEERELEEHQLNGSEAEYNSDVVFIAKEEDKILGTLHVTIPCTAPYLAGLSAMLTTPEARGKRIGSALFSEATKYIDEMGVELALLGTSNPIAAKMYAQYGFGYVFGAGVMLRYREGHQIDFNKKYLDSPDGYISIEEGNASLRLPIVPLSVYKTNFTINDINVDLVHFNIMTQVSCMGLFPRYLSLAEEGGNFFFARDFRGVVGAVASIKIVDGMYRVDFFSSDAFAPSIPKLLSEIEKRYQNIFFEAAQTDTAKATFIRTMGYTKEEESCYTCRGFTIPTTRFYKK